MDNLVNHDNGVKNLPLRDKTSLLRGDDQMRNAKESWGKNFTNDFVERVAKVDGLELVHRVCPLDFRYENQKSGIELFQKVSGPKEFLNKLSNIPFDHLP